MFEEAAADLSAAEGGAVAAAEGGALVAGEGGALANAAARAPGALLRLTALRDDAEIVNG